MLAAISGALRTGYAEGNRAAPQKSEKRKGKSLAGRLRTFTGIVQYL
jgi:hypothetical protein